MNVAAVRPNSYRSIIGNRGINTFRNSIDDLRKHYIGLFEIIQIWIENYKGEAIEIKNILGKKQTKKYIDKYHQKFLLNEKNKG